MKNPNKRRASLRGRFILLVSGILIVTFVIIAFFLVRSDQQSDIKNLNQGSKAFAALATQPIGTTYSTYQDSGSLIIDQQIRNFTNLDSDVSNVGIINLSGTTDFSQNTQPAFAATLPSTSFNTMYTKEGNGFISQIIVPFVDADGQHPYSIAYDISDSSLETDINRQIEDIITFSIVGLLISALVMYLFISRFFISPIEEVSRQAIIISKGNYEQAVNVNRNDEIGDLASSVNNMSNSLKSDIAKLQEVDAMKNEFIMITSHNLRTPLTTIRGSIEMLGSADLSPDVAKTIKQVNDSASRLWLFSEDMLTIASIEADNYSLKLEDTTIADLTDSLKEAYSSMAKEKGLTLNWATSHPAAVISVSIANIKGIIRNLLDNAIKFTDKDGQIDLKVGLENGSLVITVKDTGIGISAEEQSKLFTKFHRGTDTMEYNYAGTGIGLYAVKLIAESHHGSVHVSSELGKGSTFTVTIPQPSPAGKPAA